MSKTKCFICGKEVDKKTAFKMPYATNKNHYYCSEEEYNTFMAEKNKEDKFQLDVRAFFDLDFDITERSWKEMSAFFSELRKTYSREQILWYIEQNIDKIVSAVQKKEPFSYEFVMYRYIIAIIKNNIKFFISQNPLPDNRVEEVEVDFYMASFDKYKPSKTRRAMSDIEEEGDDDE